MNLSRYLIASAFVSMPLAASAGDKLPAPSGTVTSAQFDALDMNRDGRISPNEAASDSKIVFARVDRNNDGYIDGTEFAHRGMSDEMTPRPDFEAPGSDTDKPRK